MDKRGYLIFALLFLLMESLIVWGAVTKGQGSLKVGDKVLEELEKQGEVSVIVMLKDEPAGESLGTISVKRVEARKKMIKNVQEKVLGKLKLKERGVKSGEALGTASEENYDFKLGHKYSMINGFSGKVTKTGLKKLLAEGTVKKIESNRRLKILLDQSVPQINVSKVWNLSIGGENITGGGETVCIIDTGIDYNHSALGRGWGNITLSGYRSLNDGVDQQNCSENNSACFDDNGHGTHVAGIVASQNETYRGVAYGSKLVVVKAMDSSGSGFYSDVISGIDWCVNNAAVFNISVISMSLGCDGGGCTHWQTSCDNNFTSIASAINSAVFNNISVVIASGNSGWTDGISDPACIANATPVGAVNIGDNIIYNRGSLLSLLAPGNSIISTASSSGSICGAPGGGFGSCSGTSMATPHVAGAAALLQQYSQLKNNLTLIPLEIERIFQKTGVAVNDSGGSGLVFSRINVWEAVQRILNINISSKTVYNNYGKIIFSNNTNYNYASSCIHLINNSAYVNTSDCPEFNESAQVTLNNLSFGKTPIVLKNKVLCSNCTIISYIGNNLTFNVSRFSNYTAGANANLSIWDETDSGAKHNGVQIKFYTNYTNRTSGQAINASSGWCNISFSVAPQGPFNMSFNISSQIYKYNRSFSADGESGWNVSCSSNDFENLTLSDTVLINNTIPVVENVSLVSDDGSNRTGGNLTGSWDYMDMDNDSLQSNQTKWYNNSVEVSGLTNLTFVGSGNTTKGENWTFSVRVYDGYNWSDWVNSSVVLIRNTLPSVPSLIYPHTNYVTNITINFNWSNSYDADEDAINYTLEVSNSSSFSYLVVNYTTNQTNNTEVLNETTYYWRVKACDNEDCIYSANISFLIDAKAPGINIGNPAQGGVVNDSFFTANFTLNESNLDICVYNLTNSTGSVSSGSNDSTGYPNYEVSFSSLLDGEYNLSVVCNDSAGWSNSSVVGFNVTDSVAPTVSASRSYSGTTTITVTLTATTNEPAVCKVDTSDKNYTDMSYSMTTNDNLEHTREFSYTSDTTGTYYIRCNDSNGQVMTSSETESFNADVDEGDGGNSGGGGGGTTTAAAVEEEEVGKETGGETSGIEEIVKEPSDILKEENTEEVPKAVNKEVKGKVEKETNSLTGMIASFFKSTDKKVLLGIILLIGVLLTVYFLLQKKGKE